MDARFKVTCDHRVGDPEQQFVLLSCPRCLGRGYYYAFDYGTDGKIVTLRGVNKLNQQVIKILTENKRPSGYGFDYNVLTSTINPSTITAVKSEVMRTLTYLKALQVQEKREGFTYAPAEEISSVTGIDAFVSSNDPRSIAVNISIITVAGTLTTVATQLRR